MHPWSGDSGVAHLVVLDSSAVPSAADFTAWTAQLAALGFHTVRTGALAPRPAAQAESAGMRCIQELALLEATAPFHAGRAASRARRPAEGDFDRFAEIDRAAFGDQWTLGAPLLRDVLTATPASRARGVRRRDLGPATLDLAGDEVSRRARRDWVGFLLSGRSGHTGYVQRLAVDPRYQRHGVARSLLDDAFDWFDRHHCGRALVNTDVANVAALALYRSCGFEDLPDGLRVFEGPTAAA